MTKAIAPFVAALAVAVAGCTSVVPERPLEKLSDLGWSDVLQQSTSRRTAIDERWWQQFGDPVLSGLIAQAAANNIDLAIANSRLAEARASRRAVIAELGPRLDLT